MALPVRWTCVLRANGVGSDVVRIHTELVATFHGQRTESREVTMAWGAHGARKGVTRLALVTPFDAGVD